MKKWFTGLALGITLATAGGTALAQSTEAAKAAPAVESVDILKQNQAERTRDQPGNNAPTWRIVNQGTKNYSSLPGAETSVLIQPKAQFPGQARATTAGEAWRQYRNGPLTTYGGWLLVIVFALLAGVYLTKGQIKLSEPPTGKLIERFTSIERLSHWSVAISFVLLAVSGVTMLFGKHVLLPVFGYTLFGWFAYLCKNVHNFAGPVFAVSIVVFFVIYVKDNLPEAGDMKWMAKLGGVIGGHASAGRFNAGEKIWFWGGLTLLGLIVSASGLALDMLMPGIEYTRGNMQIANVIHVVGAVLIFSGALAHIYLGTIGTEGALQGMRTGYVDDSWAKEHHDLWYEQVQRGDIPRVRTQEKAGAAGAPAKAV